MLSLVSGGCFTTPTAPPRPSCKTAIFTDTSVTAPVEPKLSRGVRRFRRVEVNFRPIFHGNSAPTIGSSAKSIDLNLFPDLCLRVVREQVADVGGKVEWIGHVKDVLNSRVVLVFDGQLMVGTITMDRDTYRISYLGDGIHAVTDIDQAAFPRD